MRSSWSTGFMPWSSLRWKSRPWTRNFSRFSTSIRRTTIGDCKKPITGGGAIHDADPCGRDRRKLRGGEDDLAGAADPRVEAKRIKGGGDQARRAPVRHRPSREGQPPAHGGRRRHDDDHFGGEAGDGETARRIAPDRGTARALFQRSESRPRRRVP